MDNIKTGSYKELFNPENFFYDAEGGGAGNNVRDGPFVSNQPRRVADLSPL